KPKASKSPTTPTRPIATPSVSPSSSTPCSTAACTYLPANTKPGSSASPTTTPPSKPRSKPRPLRLKRQRRDRVVRIECSTYNSQMHASASKKLATTKELQLRVEQLEREVHGALAVPARGPNHFLRGYRLLRQLLEHYCRGYRILDYDDRAHTTYLQLLKLRPQRKSHDLRIAAIALAHDAILATGNLADFRPIPALKLHRVRT